MTDRQAAAAPPRRVRARTTSIAAFAVLAALIPATVSAAGTQEVDTELPYVCALPSGKLPATVRISADFPEHADVGEAFSPTGVTTTVELPPEAVADLAAREATDVRAATRLTVGVAQNTATATATWRGSAQPVALPESGPLTLVSTGDVPSVAGRNDGDLTLTAGDLAIDLALGVAAPPPTDGGAATGPGSLTVDCALAEDAPSDGLLATVPVGTGAPEPGDSPSSSGPAESSRAPEDGRRDGPGAQREERQGDRSPEVLDGSAGAAADREAPPCAYDEETPATSNSLNAYITGYSNVRKQKGASLLPLSCTLLEQGDLYTEIDENGGFHVVINATGRLHYEGRMQTPPFRSTFLTFGFVPATATMVLEQTGPMTIRFDSLLGATVTAETIIRVPLRLRVTSLEVNGTPLDVGSACRTKSSLSSTEPDPANHPGDHLVLYGRGEQAPAEPATGYMLLSGGPLTGEATIPAFTGCGTAEEDLDRLLTASVSGPGNYLKQIQGQTCSIANPVYETPNTSGECTKDLQPYQIPVAER